MEQIRRRRRARQYGMLFSVCSGWQLAWTGHVNILTVDRSLNFVNILYIIFMILGCR